MRAATFNCAHVSGVTGGTPLAEILKTRPSAADSGGASGSVREAGHGAKILFMAAFQEAVYDRDRVTDQQSAAYFRE
jgi:hypothetical protein